ncbi:hypothetical protein D3C73_1351650 [compost metagenome]
MVQVHAEVVGAGAAIARQRVHHDGFGAAIRIDDGAADLEVGRVALVLFVGEALFLHARRIDHVRARQAFRQRGLLFDDVAVAARLLNDVAGHLQPLGRHQRELHVLI